MRIKPFRPQILWGMFICGLIVGIDLLTGSDVQVALVGIGFIGGSMMGLLEIERGDKD